MVYKFPAPAGSWLPNGECVVYREPASVPGGQASCESSAEVVEECRITPDPDESTTASLTQCAARASEFCQTNPWQACCQDSESICQCATKLFNQPCNWRDYPEDLGTQIYLMPSGLTTAGDTFPYLCAAGYVGSSDSNLQTSSDCGGKCPAGYYCPTRPTLVPIICPAGSFCGEGFTTPQPCPGGTANPLTGATSQNWCAKVGPGFWAPLGSPTPKDCPPSGFYCPGADGDEVNAVPGSEPIILSTGGSSRTEEVPAMTKQLSLNIALDDYDEGKARTKPL